MPTCKLCERNTKYHCIKCGDVVCNVCSKNVPEETQGYDETIFAVGMCPNDCQVPETTGDILILEDKDESSNEPARKKVKSQQSIFSYLNSGKNKIQGKDVPVSKQKETTQKQNDTDKNPKRNISVETVKTNWIPKLLVNEHPNIWFQYSDDGKTVTSMKCSICTKYEKDIDQVQGFTREWIIGSTNFRVSNAISHAKSKSHKKAIEKFYKQSNEASTSAKEDQVTLESAFATGDEKLYQSTKKKLEVSYFVAKHELPLSKYKHILDLEEMHGVDIGSSYRNDSACAEFVDYLGEDLCIQLNKDLASANFFSVLSDGSTDCTANEQECTFVLYFDPKPMEDDAKDKVKIRMGFLGLHRLTAEEGGGTSEGVLNSIVNSFESLEITNFRNKLVGFGADGASVNRGNKDGVITLLREKMPWMIFNWCLSHRLELALKDALKGTVFDVIDEMLTNIYYLYKKSPKKLSELNMLHEEMKHTFEFDDERIKPLRSSGTRWITHKINAMRLLFDKFGLYMKHLENVSNDDTYKPQMKAKVKGYLKTWKKASILVHLGFYIDLISPVSHLSLILQKEEINPVKAIDALENIQLKLRRLKDKPFDTFRSVMTIKRKSVTNDDGTLTYEGFRIKNLSKEIENIAARKQKREYELVANVIKQRLEDNDSHYLHLIAEVLNCQGWDRTKKIPEKGNLNSDESEFSEEEKDDDEEEDIEFADENIITLRERFLTPLKHAGVDVTSDEMLDEWHDLLTFTKRYLSPKSKPIMKTWRQIFDNDGEYKNILKLIELCFVIPISNAVVERLFSRMKRVKSSKRGSINNARLENLLRIGETGETLTKGTVVSAMKLWSEEKQRRPNQVVPRTYSQRVKKRKNSDIWDDELFFDNNSLRSDQ